MAICFGGLCSYLMNEVTNVRRYSEYYWRSCWHFGGYYNTISSSCVWPVFLGTFFVSRSGSLSLNSSRYVNYRIYMSYKIYSAHAIHSGTAYKQKSIFHPLKYSNVSYYINLWVSSQLQTYVSFQCNWEVVYGHMLCASTKINAGES